MGAMSASDFLAPTHTVPPHGLPGLSESIRCSLHNILVENTFAICNVSDCGLHIPGAAEAAERDFLTGVPSALPGMLAFGLKHPVYDKVGVVKSCKPTNIYRTHFPIDVRAWSIGDVHADPTSVSQRFSSSRLR